MFCCGCPHFKGESVWYIDISLLFLWSHFIIIITIILSSALQLPAPHTPSCSHGGFIAPASPLFLVPSISFCLWLRQRHRMAQETIVWMSDLTAGITALFNRQRCLGIAFCERCACHPVWMVVVVSLYPFEWWHLWCNHWQAAHCQTGCVTVLSWGSNSSQVWSYVDY